MKIKNSKLDFTHFYPEVYQAVAGKNFTVYAYMNDGNIRLYDVTPMIEKGGVFEKIADAAVFKETLTVLNGTIAWDIGGKRDECQCIDIDPFEVYESPVVPDIPEDVLLSDTYSA